MVLKDILNNLLKKSEKVSNDKVKEAANEDDNSLALFNPISGTVKELKEINDPVFSEGYMGKGCGIVPKDNVVYSPVKGKVIGVFPTKHAITIISESGMEILLHLGINTVELKGEPFEVLVEEDQEIYIGVPLVKMNNSILKEKGYDNTVIIVITNTPSYEDIMLDASGELTAGNKLLHAIGRK